jgi:hypothetical protein
VRELSGDQAQVTWLIQEVQRKQRYMPAMKNDWPYWKRNPTALVIDSGNYMHNTENASTDT